MDRIAGRSAKDWVVPLSCFRANITKKRKNINPKLSPEGKRGIQRAIFLIPSGVSTTSRLKDYNKDGGNGDSDKP
jgi:hypothetical protein